MLSETIVLSLETAAAAIRQVPGIAEATAEIDAEGGEIGVILSNGREFVLWFEEFEEFE